MKYEIRWGEDDKPRVRRVDLAPMTDADRDEVRALLAKMERKAVCFNCGSEWSLFVASDGRTWRACWACAKTA